jgi:uncharacterized protein
MKLAMKSVKVKTIFTALLLSILLGFVTTHLSAQNIPQRPNPPRLVNDFAGLLSGSENQILENKLTAYFDSTSTQIAIVTINSLEGAPVEDFAATLGEKWGVGTKENHNGVVILISKNDRDGYIATGYGVEDGLNSNVCKKVYDNILIPNLKAGNFYAGFDAATDAMIEILSGKYVNTNPNKGEKLGGRDIIIIIIIILIIFIISSRMGGNSTTINGRGFNNMPSPWIGGGGWGGGSGSSGGFGGFGGGSFSGGGSGGKW